MADNLSCEVVDEIISRLPVSSLLRFRCVSKSWRSLIDSPIFINMHLNHTIEKDNVSLIATETKYYINENEESVSYTRIFGIEADLFDKVIEVENPLGEVLMQFEMLGSSSNGILCLAKNNGLCLLNPFTREYKKVKCKGFRLLEDNSTYGFCFDSVEEDYVLVEIIISKHSAGNKINMFSMKHSSWCSLNNTFVSSYKFVSKQLGIYMNGALHWVGDNIGCNPRIIVSFCIKEKLVKEISKPESVHDNAYKTLGVLKGELSMLSNYNTDTTGTTEIWAMKTYGIKDSWYKLFVMKKTIMKSVGPFSPHYFMNKDFSRPLFITKNGEVLLKDGRDLVIYDAVKRKNIRKHEVHDILNWSRMDTVLIHVASLVRLNSGTCVKAALELNKKRKYRKRKSR